MRLSVATATGMSFTRAELRPEPRQPAREDEVVFLDGGLQNLRSGFALLRPRQVEAPGDAKLVGPGADQFGAAALAEEQAERAEQERLPGPGFAGPGAEARVQLDAHVFDERQV